MAKIGLELRIQILLSIDFVRERMQSNTVFAILVEEEHLHSIDLPCWCQHFCWDLHVMVLENVCVRRHGLAINRVFCNFNASKIEEEIRVGRLLDREFDLG